MHASLPGCPSVELKLPMVLRMQEQCLVAVSEDADACMVRHDHPAGLHVFMPMHSQIGKHSIFSWIRLDVVLYIVRLGVLMLPGLDSGYDW
jgi:hypothetical protein